MKNLIKKTFGLITLFVGLALALTVLAHHWMGNNAKFEWKYLFGIPFFLLLINQGWTWFRNYQDLNLIALDAENEFVLRSIVLARKNLKKFQDAIRENKKEVHVKLPLKDESGNIEHIWCQTHGIKDGNDSIVIASLANEPNGDLSKYKGRFEYPVSELEDYMIMGDDEILGGYSLIAISCELRKRGHAIRPWQRKLIERHSAFKDIELIQGNA